MEIIIQRTYEDLCEETANLVVAAVRRKPNLVLGLATGRTPLGLYRRLIPAGKLFSKVRFFNLDEFYGLGPGDQGSFHRYLHEHLITPLGVPAKNVFLMRGDVPNLEKAAAAYEKKIVSVGGVDLQILGIGRNGHVGFNEPGSSLGSRTRPKTLDVKTLVDYAGTFASPDEVPRFTVTMGIGTIMEAKRILLLASGADKADIIQRVVEGPVTAEVPGSALQFHAHTAVLLDEDSSSKLVRREYWKWVYANKWRVGQ